MDINKSRKKLATINDEKNDIKWTDACYVKHLTN